MIKTILMLEDGTEIMAGRNQVNAIQSVSVEENCNSGEELLLGSVCSQKISVNIISPKNILPIKAGEKIIIYEEQNGERRKKGIFNAEKPQRKSQNTTNVVAYDNISLLDKDVTDWFNSLKEFPYSAFDMANMACEYCGLNLVNSDLRNGSFQINETKLESVTARQIIQWIGEICGYFCIANEDGGVIYKWYKNNEKTIGAIRNSSSCVFFSGTLTYEDYEVKNIDKIVIRKSDDDVGVSFPNDVDGDNAYIIQSNPFLMSSENLENVKCVADNLYGLLKDVAYTPCRVKIPSSFDFNIGDIINIIDANNIEISAYIMSKNRSGQVETLESIGSFERESSIGLYSTSFSREYGKDLNTKKIIELNTKKISENSEAIANATVVSNENSAMISEHSEIISDHSTSIADTKTLVNKLNATVSSITEWMGDETDGAVKALTEVYQVSNANTAAITSITSWQDGIDESVAKLWQETDSNGAKIGMVVKSGEFGDYVDGSVLIEAINGESVAKIKADRIILDGYLTIGSNISDLTNDSGYATQGDIPTKTSELTNDSGLAYTSQIPTKTSELTNDSGFVGYWAIPQVLSDLTNDVGYQTEDGIVSIIDGVVTADYVRALGITTTSILSQSLDRNMTVLIDSGQFSLSQYYNGRTFSAELNSAFFQAYHPIAATYFICGNANGTAAAEVGWSTSHRIHFSTGNAQLIGTWLGTSSQAVTSDAGKKHDITELDERYSVFFDAVRPVAYKYNDGTSGRYHSGFIANEIETALASAGISTQEFAGFVKAEIVNDNGETENVNCLRYEEFIAVLWREVQKIKEGMK